MPPVFYKAIRNQVRPQHCVHALPEQIYLWHFLPYSSKDALSQISSGPPAVNTAQVEVSLPFMYEICP